MVMIFFYCMVMIGLDAIYADYSKIIVELHYAVALISLILLHRALLTGEMNWAFIDIILPVSHRCSKPMKCYAELSSLVPHGYMLIRTTEALAPNDVEITGHIRNLKLSRISHTSLLGFGTIFKSKANRFLR